MFEFIRTHNKGMMIVLFLLILPSFVLFGIDGYSRMNEKGAVAAVVDGREILQSEWDAYHQREATRIRETMKQVDPKMLDTPEAKYASLERLVRDRVFAAAVEKQRITASDGRLARDLSENDAISSLKKPDGSIDMVRYTELLSRQGMSPEMFEAQVRRDLSLRQVVGGIGDSSVMPAAVIDRGLGAFYERRQAEVMRFNASEYMAKVTLTDAEAQAYYDANLSKFQAPESADVEMLVLSLDSVRKGLKINPEDVTEYYKNNKARLSSQEERRASHILFAAGKDVNATVKGAARAKAAEVLASVKAKPSSFAELAKKNSDDPGSKDNGGDLDFFGRGSMVKPFEDKAFAMEKGQISDLVETDFGFHIIMLTDIKAPKERSFEEAKPDLENDLRKQQAQAKFAEFAEPFTNSVFENADTFKPTAERFSLTPTMLSNVQRKALPGVTGPTSNQRFLDALFAADSISSRRNTAAIDIGNNQLASGRLVKYAAARQLTFAEVKDQAKLFASIAKATAMAKADGERALAALKAGEAVPGLGQPVAVSRDSQGEARQPQMLVEAVLRVDGTKLPQSVGVDVAGLGYIVARVGKVLEREAATGERATNERKQVADFWGNAESMAYLNLLKTQFKVDMKVAKPEAKAADPL